jgi:protein-S-isoprenylcysteine O-methyltransferase Ste14
MLVKLAGLCAGVLLYAAIGYGVFLLAGRRDLPFFWAVLSSQILIGTVGSLMLSPELIAERVRPKGKDKDPFGVLVLSVLCVAQLAIAALDVGRWHITDNVPFTLQCAAFILQTLGWIAFYWSMFTNKFFSSAIRIQEDRGQIVVSSGPYQYIRHPGYAFGSLAFITESIAFGSWLSVLPALLIAAYLFYRTILEERMLNTSLPGYTEYAKKVRYRWIPGVW